MPEYALVAESGTASIAVDVCTVNGVTVSVQRVKAGIGPDSIYQELTPGNLDARSSVPVVVAPGVRGNGPVTMSVSSTARRLGTGVSGSPVTGRMSIRLQVRDATDDLYLGFSSTVTSDGFRVAANGDWSEPLGDGQDVWGYSAGTAIVSIYEIFKP